MIELKNVERSYKTGPTETWVMWLVLVSGTKLGLMGCGIGAIGAVFATRLLRSMLFQVDPLDPAVIVLAAVSIFLLALDASLVSASRAASIEPMHYALNSTHSYCRGV
jgi:ABC-type lipoprotein release transport system permease subunit